MEQIRKHWVETQDTTEEEHRKEQDFSGKLEGGVIAYLLGNLNERFLQK